MAYKSTGFTRMPGGSLIRSPGNIFYVNANGFAANTGLSPSQAFNSVTNALAACTTGNHDYIVVMNNTSANEAAFPIEIAIDFVHIIGLWGDPYPNPTLMATDANPTFQINDGSTWIEIGGIDFGAGAADGCIQIGSAAGDTSYIWIHHCVFGYDGAATAQDGIRWLLTHADAQTYVEDCIFGALLTRDGIRMDGNNTRGVFRNNLFRGVPGIGINVNVNGADLGTIQDNRFVVPDATDGEAITFIAGAGNALVTGNIACQADNPMLFNPYRDLSTGVAGTALNDWSMNYRSNAVTFPATA